MNQDDINQVKRIAKEVFWETMEEDILPLLKDFISVKLDASKTKAERTNIESGLSETTFSALKYEHEEGAKLGKYEAAYLKGNISDNWHHAFNILKNSNALINQRFHERDYIYSYWIYPEKPDRILRKKLSEAKQ